jgi:hypothetical protein
MGYIYKVNTYGYKVDNCSSMTTPEECICCVEVPAVHSQMLSEDMQCITDSDIFISNCLNRCPVNNSSVYPIIIYIKTNL